MTYNYRPHSVWLDDAIAFAVANENQGNKDLAVDIPNSFRAEAPYNNLVGPTQVRTGSNGVIIRRNPLVIFMSIELMLNAANLAFVAFGHRLGSPDGQALVFFVMAVAAAEVAVGLAILVAVFRGRHHVDVDRLNTLKY